MGPRAGLPIAAWLGLCAALLPGRALAIGLCENTPTTYALEEIAPQADLLIFRVETQRCQEVFKENLVSEKRTTTAQMLVTNLQLKNRRFFVADRAKAPAGVGGAAAYAALRQGKDLRPIRDVAMHPPGGRGCKVESVVLHQGKAVSYEDAPRARGDFTTRSVGLLITTAGPLPPLPLARHTIDAGPLAVWTVRLQGGLRSYYVSATCGGPPPGYFGPDDGGTCYPHYSLGYKDHPGRELPAACAADLTAAPPRLQQGADPVR